MKNDLFADEFVIDKQVFTHGMPTVSGYNW